MNMRLGALMLLGLLAAGAVVDAAGAQGARQGKGRVRHRKGPGAQGHRKSMVRINGGGGGAHKKVGPGGYRVRKAGGRIGATKRHGRNLNQWGIDAIFNGVSKGISTGLDVVAPVVNSVASKVPVLVPALPGPECLTGELVILGDNHDLFFCKVGYGDQVTNALFNTVDAAAGAASYWIPNLVNTCWRCLGDDFVDGFDRLAGGFGGLGRGFGGLGGGVPLRLPLPEARNGGPINSGPIRNSRPGSARNNGPGPVGNNVVNNGNGPLVTPLVGPGSGGPVDALRTTSPGRVGPAPINTRPASLRNTRVPAPTPAPRNIRGSNTRLPNSATPTPNRVQG